MKTNLHRVLSLLPAAVVAVSLFVLVGPSWVVEGGVAQDLPGEWQTLAPSSKNRLEVSYVQAGGRFYLAGGTTSKPGLTLHERYNPVTNSWEQVEPLPKGLHHIQAVELNGLIYYVGGMEGTPGSGAHGPSVGTVYVYDPSTDTFSEGTPMPAGRDRGAGATVVYDGKIYYAGGQHDDPADGYNPVSVPWFDVYDPATKTWTQLPDMPRVRDHFHGAVVDGKVYAIGGRQKDVSKTLSRVDVYDLASGTGGTWQTPDTALPTSNRSGFTTAVLGKEVLVIGGEGGGIAHNKVEAYDTANNSWRTLEPMPTGRHGIQATVCNGGVYIAAGGSKQGGGPTNVHQVFFLNGPTTCESPPGDTLPPATKPPVQSLVGNTTVGASTVPVKLAWSATDSDSGVAKYELQQSEDGGPYTSVTLPSATATTTTASLQPGKSYRFQVRAQDQAGNWSGWKPGPKFRVDLLQETDGAIAYTGVWNAESLSGALGGGVRYASTSGDSAKLTFESGLNVGWVAPKGPNRGIAELWNDGVRYTSTRDLYSSSVQPGRLIYTKNGLNATQQHTLEVRLLGTKNAKSSGTRVDVDAFVVLTAVP